MPVRNLLLVILTAFALALLVAFVVVPQVEKDTAPPPPALLAAATPEPAIQAQGRAAFIDRETDGHFWTNADVSGTQVRFMVDTGASIVALTYFDAQRLGLKPEELNFDAEIRTAGGSVLGAYVTLDSIRIGEVEVEKVSAVILRTELGQSLLGMSFLGELQAYEVRRGQMIIRQ
jgi:aspartyl protease family protein